MASDNISGCSGTSKFLGVEVCESLRELDDAHGRVNSIALRLGFVVEALTGDRGVDCDPGLFEILMDLLGDAQGLAGDMGEATKRLWPTPVAA